MKTKISAVILTKNEGKNIERCLKSVMFCDEVIVVDDDSTDNTLEIVHKVHKVYKVYKVHKVCKVFRRKVNGDFAGQRNFGLEKTSGEWVLFLDADEEVTDNLKLKIKNLKFYKDAYYIPRRDFFWGKEIKHGELRQIRLKGLIRLVKKNSGQWQRKVHEEFRVKNEKFKIGKLDGFINHYPHPSLKEFIKDINYYSTLRAKELYISGKKTNFLEVILFAFGKFIYNYFFKFGFLDGVEGFFYSFLMSFHSFLVRAKLYTYLI